MLISFFIVLAAHLWSDFALQGSHVSTFKCEKRFLMGYHVTLYSLIMSITLFYTFQVPLWSFVVLFISHWWLDTQLTCRPKIVDVFKVYPQSLEYFDLLCHLLVILILIGVSNA